MESKKSICIKATTVLELINGNKENKEAILLQEVNYNKNNDLIS